MKATTFARRSAQFHIENAAQSWWPRLATCSWPARQPTRDSGGCAVPPTIGSGAVSSMWIVGFSLTLKAGPPIAETNAGGGPIAIARPAGTATDVIFARPGAANVERGGLRRADDQCGQGRRRDRSEQCFHVGGDLVRSACRSRSASTAKDVQQASRSHRGCGTSLEQDCIDREAEILREQDAERLFDIDRRARSPVPS
jgi:hypothetical protein